MSTLHSGSSDIIAGKRKHAVQCQILFGASLYTYVLHKLHSHLLLMETYIYRILGGP